MYQAPDTAVMNEGTIQADDVSKQTYPFSDNFLPKPLLL